MKNFTRHEADRLQHELDQRLPPNQGAAGRTALPPDEAGDLEPLLKAAERLAAAPPPHLSAAARQRIESRLHQQMAGPRRVSRFPQRGLWLRLVAACLVLVFVMLGAVQASASSVPGDVLYPVKRGTESVQLALASPESANDLRLRFAERRLDEFEVLLARDRVEPALLATTNDYLTTTLDNLTASKQPRLDNIAQLAARQQTLTGRALAAQPNPAQAERLAAIEARRQSLVARVHAQQDQPDNDDAGQGVVTVTPLISETPVPTTAAPPSPTFTAQPTAMPSLEVTATQSTPATSGTPVASYCARGMGYWRTQDQAWPVETLELGEQTYTAAELLTLLQTPPAGDASLILAQHMITAYLNVAEQEASAPAALVEGDTLLAQLSDRLPLDVAPSSPVGQQMLALAAELDCDQDPDTGDAAEGGINCDNPPPTHAPATGWREQCGEAGEGRPGGGRPDGVPGGPPDNRPPRTGQSDS